MREDVAKQKWALVVKVRVRDLKGDGGAEEDGFYLV